jgi:hypothetical protein
MLLWIEKPRLCQDRSMDLKVPWKALSKQGAPSSKWGAFSVKQIAFFVVVGLALVVGIVLRSGQFFGEPGAEQNAPVTVAAPPPPAAAPVPPVETTESPIKTPPAAQESGAPNKQQSAAPNDREQTQTGEAADQTEQANETVGDAGRPESAGSGPILVSRQPIAMLASPSSSAPTLYGFPAGRPFRVIGHNGGFAQIKDLRSGATGWIDEAALAPTPGSPALSSPSQPKPVVASRKSAEPSTAPATKPKAPKKDSQVTTGSEETTDPVQTPKRPGLFGGGGLFGGIFGGGNGNAN